MPSTTRQNYEQLSYGGAASQWRGQHKQIIADAAATRTLTAKEAGALCLFDRAAGVVYTLPTPVAGMHFEFFATVSVTSNAHKVQTSSAAVFLLGAVTIGTIATASAGGFAANGTSIVGISSAGSVTGGLIGTRYVVTAISTTQWAIRGFLIGSGTIETPFV